MHSEQAQVVHAHLAQAQYAFANSGIQALGLLLFG